MRLRVCVSCLIWPDAVFRDHLHGHNSPPPQSWKSDLIDIITRLTYSVVSREAQDNCTRSIDFSLCCYTNALKRRKEGGGPLHDGPILPVVQMVVVAVSCSVCRRHSFLSLCRRTTLDRTHKLIKYSAVGSICVPKLSPSFLRGRDISFVVVVGSVVIEVILKVD